MPERDVRERDILVAPNEYAYVQDLTKGDIVLYVGPTKISLSNTERLVEFKDGRFKAIKADDGYLNVNPNVMASTSQYIILENPAKDSNAKPVKGNNSAIELLTGRRTIVSGPASFPLWPGQKACVIDGHELRENEYLVVRIYDNINGDDSPIGTERIIKGNEQNFYIPTTGLEVVPDEGGFIRKAVTLLDGEYCILLSPNGQKKYRIGPDVVFPEPMEDFVVNKNSRVFQAYHLKKNMGLLIRVMKDFTSENDSQIPAGEYKSGQDIFIKDMEGFFYPTENIEVRGEVEAIPLAEKEGVYVRNLDTGMIITEVGHKNFLPDLTKYEIVNRHISNETQRLYGLTNHKPEKAISVYIPPSFAVLVMTKDKREVVVGPKTRILNFDEDLEILKLSTGKPKNDDNLLSTCFLQVTGNKVSDIVTVTTSDHVKLEVLLSYRVSFNDAVEAEREKWFSVKNYVDLLCDHLGSIIRGAVRNCSIEQFHSNSTEIMRSAVLGEKKGEEKRSGCHFAENGMWVYDIEVLNVSILDANVEKLVSDAQRAAILSDVQKKKEALRLGNEKFIQEVEQQICESQKATFQKSTELEEFKRNLEEIKVGTIIEVEKMQKVGRAKNEAESLEISSQAKVDALKRESMVELEKLNANVVAFKEQMSAMSPELISTLKTLGNQHLASELTKNLSPLAIMGGNSVAEVAERLLKSLPISLDGITKNSNK